MLGRLGDTGHSLAELSSTLGVLLKICRPLHFMDLRDFFFVFVLLLLFFVCVINVQCLRYYNEMIS